MTREHFPKLHFQHHFDSAFASEVRSRGWLDGVTVEMSDWIAFTSLFTTRFALPKTSKKRRSSGDHLLRKRIWLCLMKSLPKK